MEKDTKPRISHIALKVDDLEATAKFYMDVFGFTKIAQHRDGDHVSFHMTDGNLDLALVKYDTADSVIGSAAGDDPCIHHFGIDVPNIPTYKKKLEDQGVETFNDPTNPKVPVWKFRAPGGGGICEIGPFKWHQRDGKDEI
jgi:lactoylglutathione lyase